MEVRSNNTKDSLHVAKNQANITASRNEEEAFNDAGTYGAVNETVGSVVGSLASAATSAAVRTIANAPTGAQKPHDDSWRYKKGPSSRIDSH